MNIKILLVKAITLLYRESQLSDLNETSSDMIQNVISKMTFPEAHLGLQSELDILSSLKNYIIELCSNSSTDYLDKDTVLQRLKVICNQDEKLYEAFFQGIDKEHSDPSIKRIVTNLRQSFHNHYREEEVKDIIEKAAYKFKFKRDQIKDIGLFVSETLSQLEPYQNNNKLKDPAIISDIDIGDESKASEIFKDVKDLENGDGVLQTGWHAMNRMLQGGFRRGDEVVIGALQHNYKTGFSLSLFKQIALYNKPHMLDPNKKPLLLRISFEDDLALNFKFLFLSLIEDDAKMKNFDVSNISNETMATYIKMRLQVNGYHIRMMRVDPTQWSYRHILNKIIEFEAEGYEVHMVMLDYLAMVPTTGCIVGGPMGADVRDMYRRMRNFCAPKKITLITPHQLSTEAKMLIREGRDNFVQEIAGKGYYDRTKTLDQEVDIELYIHIEKRNKEAYLTVQRGKHRIPTIIEDENKYFVLKFPKGKPIPDDISGEDNSLSSLPKKSMSNSYNNDDNFGF